MNAPHRLTDDHGETRPFLAMGLRIIAMLAISVMFACAKWSSERDANIVEILFYRQLFALPVAVGSLFLGPGLAALRTPHKSLHLSRSVFGMISMVLSFLGYILLPLAEATTIGFTMPIFATLMSVFFLGERPGIHRWAAVITGFLGVLVIVGPGGHAGVNTPGLAAALGAALLTAAVSLLIWQLGGVEPPAVIVFYFAALSLPFLAVLMPWFAQAHDPETWAALIATGLIGGVAQLLLTSALRWGPVSLVLPMDYSSLLWSTALGWLIWQNWPGNSTWAGAAIIAGSSLYILWRERLKHLESLDREISAP